MGRSKLFSCLQFISILKGKARFYSAAASPPPPGKYDTSSKPCDRPDRSRSKGASKDNPQGVVLGVYQCEEKTQLTEDAANFDAEHGGIISKHLNMISSSLQLGKATLLTDLELGSTVALASIGPKDACYNHMENLDERRENMRVGVGAGVRLLQQAGCDRIKVDGAVPEAAAEAAHLASWRFEAFKTEGRHSKPQISPIGAAASGWQRGEVLGRCQNWARYLSDMPANKMTPIDFAQECLDVLCPLGVSVVVHERAWIEAQNMQAFMAVAKGSCEHPVMLQMEYKAGEGAPMMLTGKGVTFDCGGLCLKRHKDMIEARGCMAGAAVVAGAIRAVAELKESINLVALIPLCENLVSGQCMKVGDVVQALNGLSIEIEDTDNEGRLMLADTLVYGQTVFQPKMVVDVSTLSRSIQLATGEGAFGVFSSSPSAWAGMKRAGGISGDRPWLFPTWDFYHKRITDNPAVDLRNRGSGKASACKGAAFLQRFVCKNWMHLDVTGVGRVTHNGPVYLRAGRMSGRPTRTLAEFLIQPKQQTEEATA